MYTDDQYNWLEGQARGAARRLQGLGGLAPQPPSPWLGPATAWLPPGRALQPPSLKHMGNKKAMKTMKSNGKLMETNDFLLYFFHWFMQFSQKTPVEALK